ncbi:hypothetical protein IT408_03595 [Candidatus Uhrbacteria bacterium]|nr:hypothetical protein [Candidatus Uhrbacteria bacterium]
MEDFDENLEEQDDEDGEEEEEEEEEEKRKMKKYDQRQNPLTGGDPQKNHQTMKGKQNKSRRKDWKDQNLRSSWLATLGPETIRFGMSRLVAALVRRGMKTEKAETVRSVLASKLGHGGVKNVLIPLLQITGNIPPAFRTQLQHWGLPHDSIDILNDALNDVFEATYLEYDAVGETRTTSNPLKEPTFQDAVNQLDVRQGLIIDRIIQKIKQNPDASKKFEQFRPRLTQKRDLEMIIAFVAEQVSAEGVSPDDIIAFIERRCGELPPKAPPAKTFASRFGAIGKSVADMLPASGGVVTEVSASSSLTPLHQAVANARWADSQPVFLSKPGFMDWVRKTRLYNFFFDPPAPPTPPTAPGGAAPGP